MSDSSATRNPQPLAAVEPNGSLIVLASASPRRHTLLARAGVAFEARPANLDESPRRGEPPEETLARLARAKAVAVAAEIGEPLRLVLGADTGVLLGDELFGKPRDPGHAVEMLAQLVGRTHRVITEVAIAQTHSAQIWQCRAESRVTLRSATRDELARYVAGGEPLDKAGAYAFQGEGRAFVSRVEGSESNVIGLPLEETLALLACARAAIASFAQRGEAERRPSDGRAHRSEGERRP